MSEPQIEQDPTFQRRFWRIQRAGWMVMGAALVAALLGFFGRGPFSHATLGGPDGRLQLDYERLAQHEAASVLTLRFRPRDGPSAEVWIDRLYLTKVQVDGIVPPPVRAELSPDRVTYLFGVSPSEQPVIVTVQVRMQEVGMLSGRLGLAGGETVSFRQFVYP